MKRFLTPQVFPVELPPKCVFYIDPDLDIRNTKLIDYASDGSKKLNAITEKEVAAPNGMCRYLNGSTDCFYIDSYSAIDITNVSPDIPMSVFGWINIDPTAATNGYIVAKNNVSSADMQYGYFYSSSNNDIFVWINGAERCAAYKAITKGAWYFVGFDFDGNTVNIWVNGKIVKTSTYNSSALTSRPNFSIGRRAGGFYSKGLFGQFAIARCKGGDVVNWAIKTDKFQKYGVAV